VTATRVAVVTGTSGAIGSAIAHGLAASGWSVVGVDTRPGDGAVSLAAEVTGDVAKADIWLKVAGIVDRSGHRLDGLVHAAAIQICEPLDTTSEDDWDRLLAVNAKAAFLAARHLRPQLARARGAVVGLGSVHSRATSANIAVYAASKGAVAAMFRALAIEWASDGIRVNTVLPGAVDSDMLRAGLARGHLGEGSAEDRLKDLASRTVMGRIGNPKEIAEMVCFLLDSARSGFITGAEFVVDGGALARLSTE